MADVGVPPVLVSARDLARQAGARSAEIEQARTLPADLVADLSDAGLFRTFVPASLGGAEATVADGLAVIEELAAADGSTGWCVMIADDHRAARRVPAGRPREDDLRAGQFDHRRVRRSGWSGDG